jgi:hypothetical protein
MSEMRDKWKRYNLWIIYIILTVITVAIFVILCCVYPTTDQDNARYILSAISQGLAAILTLVFTITLVVAQMTRRYTAMDKIIFRWETIFLMIVFGVGVVTPLLVLKFGFWGQGVNVSIALAFFCVFSLLPFLKGVNGVLKYDIGVENLYEESMTAINLEDEAGTDARIGELVEIGKGAVKESCERVVVNIVRRLSQIGKKCAEKGEGNATFWVVNSLKDIGVESVGRRFEEASFFAATGLKGIELEVAKIGLTGGLWDDSATDAIDGLKDIGTKAAEKGLKKWDITIRAVEGLKDVFTELHKSRGLKDREESERQKYIAVNGVWCLGAFVMEYLPEQCDRVIQKLKEIGSEIGRDWLMKYEEGCIVDHPNLKSALEVFKKRYNEG